MKLLLPAIKTWIVPVLILLMNTSLLFAQSPGGVTGSLLWLKANAGVTGTTNVTQWNDQSGNVNNATAVTATAPTLSTGLINFNPYVSFVGTADFMQITAGIFKTATVTPWGYGVMRANTFKDSYVFTENLKGKNRFYSQQLVGTNFRMQYDNRTLDFNVNSQTGVFNFWTGSYATTGTTPSDQRGTLMQDGSQVATVSFNNSTSGNNSPFYIGSQDATTTATRYDGDIAEIIIFNAIPTALQQQQVHTYLALKYGITMGTFDQNAGVTEGDYVLSDGTTKVWDFTASSTYHNSVAGIVRDDTSGLLQKQAKSHTTSAIITMGLGSIAASNTANAGSIAADKSALVWGATTATGTTSAAGFLCSPSVRTINRSWKVQETGSIGSVQVAAEKTGLDALFGGTAPTVILMKVATDAAFTTGLEYFTLTQQAVNGVQNYVANYDFNGTRYVTFTEVVGIVWNGVSQTWLGNGTGTAGAPGVSDTGKLVIVDPNGTTNFPTLNASAVIGCVWVKTGGKMVVATASELRVQNQLQMDGDLRLIGTSQLIQTHTGASQITGSGKIYLDQTATSATIYRLNYLSSPVKMPTNNFTVAGVLKDGSIPTSATSIPQNITFIFGFDGNFAGSPATPITLSNRFILGFLNNPDTWTLKRETGTFLPGEGFSLKGPGRVQNYTFVGTPNDGDITSFINADNFSLLGNPYPSALDATAFINQNSTVLDGSLYFWEQTGDSGTHNVSGYQGGYGVRNATQGVAANQTVAGTAGLGNATYTAPGQYIPVGQSFFVTGLTGSPGGNVTFSNSQRIFKQVDGTTSVQFKANNRNDQIGGLLLSAKKQKIIPAQQYSKANSTSTSEITLTTTDIPIFKLGFEYTHPDGVRVHRQIGANFVAGHTFAFDAGFDTFAFDQQPTDALWKFAEIDWPLVIAGLGEFNTTYVMPLNVDIVMAQTVDFIIDETVNIPTDILLNDNLTGAQYNLSSGKGSVEVLAGNYPNRFTIAFKPLPETPLPDVEDIDLLKDLLVYYSNKTHEIVINPCDCLIRKVELFNIFGQSVQAWGNLSGTQEVRLLVDNLKLGVYIIKLSTSKGSISKKVIVSKGRNVK